MMMIINVGTCSLSGSRSLSRSRSWSGFWSRSRSGSWSWYWSKSRSGSRFMSRSGANTI